jgi:phage terminase large subunit-like protein
VSDTLGRDLIARLTRLDPVVQGRVVRSLSRAQRRELNQRWALWAHDGQIEPPGDWRVWLIRAGRGFGKTRAGAEWVSAMARGMPEARIALVGATIEDVRRVMIEGESGILRVAHQGESFDWRRDAGELRFASGAIAYVYSAEAPEKLRGPEHAVAWCDELAKWRNGDVTWDNLMMTMRISERPRVLVTTTPRPTALMRRVMTLEGVVETLGRTRDNEHLPASFVAAMHAMYGASVLGRQELDGELIEDLTGALWSRAGLEACRVRLGPELVRVVIGVDPPAGTGGDACGIVVAGLGRDGRGYVLDDASVQGASPEGWAQAVARAAARWRVDRVIAEANQGGAMVKSVLLAADCGLPVTLVHATRGKSARAEPVATLYEAGRVSHVGAFAALEDELCGLIAGGGYEGPGRSPDRADALVWALAELMLGRRGEASVRRL